jgi:hypothetical protein
MHTQTHTNTQVEALGMALDKMKGVLDASGSSIAMMSVKRGASTSSRTSSPSGKGGGGLMKKMTGLGLGSLRRGSKHSATSSVSSPSVPEEDAPAQPIDSIPDAPVAIKMSPGVGGTPSGSKAATNGFNTGTSSSKTASPKLAHASSLPPKLAPLEGGEATDSVRVFFLCRNRNCCVIVL